MHVRSPPSSLTWTDLSKGCPTMVQQLRHRAETRGGSVLGWILLISMALI